eukprot:TRINITY_DN1239_c3_g1_i1.p1 TRINITY_DN1239_c3_g1~~TRINITY_DN1239_c3_g1_i1.p1  ORF type:complete len:380 (-),score=70.70 TRINITY_DN1239_c3_g1_i1:57-1157(-)
MAVVSSAADGEDLPAARGLDADDEQLMRIVRAARRQIWRLRAQRSSQKTSRVKVPELCAEEELEALEEERQLQNEVDTLRAELLAKSLEAQTLGDATAAAEAARANADNAFADVYTQVQQLRAEIASLEAYFVPVIQHPILTRIGSPKRVYEDPPHSPRSRLGSHELPAPASVVQDQSMHTPLLQQTQVPAIFAAPSAAIRTASSPTMSRTTSATSLRQTTGPPPAVLRPWRSQSSLHTPADGSVLVTPTGSIGGSIGGSLQAPTGSYRRPLGQWLTPPQQAQVVQLSSAGTSSLQLTPTLQAQSLHTPSLQTPPGRATHVRPAGGSLRIPLSTPLPAAAVARAAATSRQVLHAPRGPAGSTELSA